MDNNKIQSIIGPGDIDPVMRYATYFQTKPGERWGERVIDDLELIFVVAGRFAYERPGLPTVYHERGDVLAISPMETHTYLNLPGGGRGVIGCIHCEPVRGVAWRDGGCRFDPAMPLVTVTHADPVLDDLFRRATDVFEGYGRFRDALLGAVCREILIRMFEYWGGCRGGEGAGRVGQMQSFVRQRLTGPIGRRDIASAFSITPEHVDHVFKRELGVTPTEFINRERVFMSLRLMREKGLSVKEAALSVGFSDQFYFSRVFSRIMKMPPGKARAAVFG